MDRRALKELGLLEISRWYAIEAEAVAVAEAPAAPAPAPVATAAIGAAGWDALRQLVADCRACGLCKQRKQAVFGVGAAAGPWLFIGEGPGADEDEQGEPFVGQAGRMAATITPETGARPATARPLRRKRPRARRSSTGRSTSWRLSSSWRWARPR